MGSPAVISVGIVGVAGRMGRQLVAAVAEHEHCRLSAGLEVPGSSVLGSNALLLAANAGASASELEVKVTDKASEVINSCDVIIDFSRPDASLAMLQAVKESARSSQESGTNGADKASTATCAAIVIGTTGFSDAEKKKINEYAREFPLVMASNYSVGVTLCLDLLKTTAASLGDSYDVEVIEAHHRNKIDAPSGTALSMGEAVAGALGRDLADCAVYGRQGNTGVRNGKEIGFETIRGGDIIGDHTVLFAGDGERIEITHRATDRMAFARGAVRAAHWLVGQSPGLYDMSDVIGLSKLKR